MPPKEQGRGSDAESGDFTAAHARGVAALPPLHRGPFDRMLVAQALAEPLRLLTRDAKLAAYSDIVTLV